MVLRTTVAPVATRIHWSISTLQSPTPWSPTSPQQSTAHSRRPLPRLHQARGQNRLRTRRPPMSPPLRTRAIMRAGGIQTAGIQTGGTMMTGALQTAGAMSTGNTPWGRVEAALLPPLLLPLLPDSRDVIQVDMYSACVVLRSALPNDTYPAVRFFNIF